MPSQEYLNSVNNFCKEFLNPENEVLEISYENGVYEIFNESDSLKLKKSGKEGYEDSQISKFVSNSEKKYNYIIVRDVISYSHDIYTMLKKLREVCKDNSKIAFIWSKDGKPNPLEIEKVERADRKWEKNWISIFTLENLLYLNDFEVVKTGEEYFLPDTIFSKLLKPILCRIPVLENYGSFQYVVAKKLKRSERKNHSVSVIIPCYNEEKNIRRCIKSIPEVGSETEIVVVDDGSTDNTREIANEMKRKEENLRVISYDKNQGKGYATKIGLDAAENDILMILDADMSVPSKDLFKFLEPLERDKGRFVNGSRMVYPIEKEAMKDLHVIGNKIFRGIFQLLLNQYITDTLCGTKAILNRDYSKIEMKERSWPDFDLITGASELDLKLVEIPVHYKERVGGKSKMKTLSNGLTLLKTCLKSFWKLKLKKLFHLRS